MKPSDEQRYFLTPDPSMSKIAIESWVPMVKKTTSVVFMWRQEVPFTVDTNEGPLRGQPGDYVAHDPVSGHFWPVAASYVDHHYERAPK